MTISEAFNEIAVKLGGAKCNDSTIVGSIDALNDALAGSDQPRAQTIEEAVRMLGDLVGGSSYELHVQSLLGPFQTYSVQHGSTTAELEDSTWVEDGKTVEGRSCKVRAGEIVVVQSANSITVDPKYLGGYLSFSKVPCTSESGLAWVFVMPSHEVSCLVS